MVCRISAKRLQNVFEQKTLTTIGFDRHFTKDGLQNFLQDIYSVMIRVIAIYIRCFAEKKIFIERKIFEIYKIFF